MTEIDEFLTENTSDIPNEIDVIEFRESEEGKRLLAWAQQKFNALKSARYSAEVEWKENLLLYNGKHYAEKIVYPTLEGKWGDRPRSNKERLTINRVESVIRTEMAKLTSQKPNAYVTPASSEDEDLFAAMAGEQVWEAHSTRLEFDSEMTGTAFWTTVTGNGFMKTYWDDEKLDVDSGQMGDVIFEAVSPFNLLFPDLRETELKNQGMAINYYAKPVEYLELKYANELDGITIVPSVNASDDILEDVYLGSLNGGEKKEPDSCILREYWILPGKYKILPNGGYFVTIDDKVLVEYYDQGIPYHHGELPFTHFGHIYTGKFYRRSVIQAIKDPQKEYNSIRSQISESRKKMGKLQLAAQKGSISASRMNNEIGTVIEYRQGFQAPQPLPVQEVPNYIQNELAQVLTDIEDLTGQHQVSKGNVPSQVTAATAISYLQERDDSYLSYTYTNVERGCTRVARQTLALIVQYWEVPRLIRVAGEDNTFDTMLLSGADIASATDIRMEESSSIPRSRAARQATIMDLMNTGFIPPEQGLELLEIGGAQKIIDQLRIDQRHAQRENIRLKSISPEEIYLHRQEWEERAAQGDPQTIDADSGQSLEPPPVLPVNEWDNHEVHIEIHNRLRKTQAFEFLTDEVKAEIEAHVQQHKLALIQVTLQSQLDAMFTDGSVPGVDGRVPAEEPLEQPMGQPSTPETLETQALNPETLPQTGEELV